MKSTLRPFLLTAPVLLSLFSLPATAQLLGADTSLENSFKDDVGSSYKKQTVRYDHNGYYTSDPVMTTNCVNIYDHRIVIDSSPYDYLMASPQERDFTSIVSGGNWLCASKMDVSAWLGASKTYSLNRCENVDITTKGTSGYPRANITYSNCTEEGVTFYRDCNYSSNSRILGVGSFKRSAFHALGLDNDWISSIKVPAGYEVELYEHDNFEGESIVLTSDDSCLVDNGFNDKVSSLRVSIISDHDDSYTYGDKWGGDGGHGFDHMPMLQQMSTAGDEPYIEEIGLRSGGRVDQISIKYSNDAIVEHGGDGGGYSSTGILPATTTLQEVEVCKLYTGFHNATTVHYVKFTLSNGETLSGGTRDGECATLKSDQGYPIVGFYGGSGEELDSLGIIVEKPAVSDL